jgi:hypothetical protein
MLNNIFTHGSGGSSGIDYGLSEHDHTGQLRSVLPAVLYGSAEIVKRVVDVSTFAQRYTAGVLAFAESHLPSHLKRQIIAEHLAVTFPGLDPTRVAALYVEHRDKGFLEIHYWLGNTDLVTGKRLEAYWHRADCPRLKRWVKSVNARFGLADPDDPKHRRLAVKPKKNQSASRKNIQTEITQDLERRALAGGVRCRQDIEQLLAADGWTISRRSKNFISITRADLKQPIRLVGRMFAVEWSGAQPQAVLEQLHHDYQATRVQRLCAAVSELVPLLRKRAAANAKRYRSDYSIEPFVESLVAAAKTLSSLREAESVRLPGPREPQPGPVPIAPTTTRSNDTWKRWKKSAARSGPKSEHFSPSFRPR